jgi:hypothetical protein
VVRVLDAADAGAIDFGRPVQDLPDAVTPPPPLMTPDDIECTAVDSASGTPGSPGSFARSNMPSEVYTVDWVKLESCN